MNKLDKKSLIFNTPLYQANDMVKTMPLNNPNEYFSNPVIVTITAACSKIFLTLL